MSVVERVSRIDSNVTALTSDYDFSAWEARSTNNTSGVMFSDMTTKAELALSGTSGTVSIAPGKAIIQVTRATSSPIANQKVNLIYQLSESKSLSVTSGDKIYIEVDQSLIDTPTSIEDTYPSTTYAQGKGIAELKASQSYPGTNTYLPLYTSVGYTWTDVRTSPRVDGDRVDMSAMEQDITTTGKLSATSYATPSGDIQTQIDQINTDIGTVDSIFAEFTAGENINAGQCVYLNATSGAVYLTDADIADTLDFLGIARETKTTGQTIKVDIRGINTLQSGLTPGTTYYISGTAGALSSSGIVPVGKAVNSTSIYIGSVKESLVASGFTMTFNSNDTRTYKVGYPEKIYFSYRSFMNSGSADDSISHGMGYLYRFDGYKFTGIGYNGSALETTRSRAEFPTIINSISSVTAKNGTSAGGGTQGVLSFSHSNGTLTITQTNTSGSSFTIGNIIAFYN